MIEYHLHKLWRWMPMAGITIGKHVFLKNVLDGVALEHELIHVEQQRTHGLWFWLSYLLLLPVGWNPWRARWEAEAYQAEIRAGYHPSIIAHAMSGWLYGWCCRYDTAIKLLTLPKG